MTGLTPLSDQNHNFAGDGDKARLAVTWDAILLVKLGHLLEFVWSTPCQFLINASVLSEARI